MKTPTLAAKAPEPTRSTQTVTIRFGLVSIAASLYTSNAPEPSLRREFVSVGGEMHPVGRTPYDKETGQPVEKADVVRLATATDGTLVPVTDDELLERLGHKDLKGMADVVATIDVKEALRLEPDATYQVRPKRGAGSDKALALLLETLRAAGKAAVVQTVGRGYEAKHAVIFGDGTFRVVVDPAQQRVARDLPKATFSEGEANAARALLDALPSVDAESVGDDQRHAKVQAAVDAIAAEADGAPVVSLVPQAAAAEPIDDPMLALLAQSVELADKKGA